MSETQAAAPAAKPRRQYKKREPEFPVATSLPSAADLDAVAADESARAATAEHPLLKAPNLAVVQLQGDVVNLIRSRTHARHELQQAHASLLQAQTTFQVAQENLRSLEQEVQYLHSQIAQLEGRDVMPQNYINQALPIASPVPVNNAIPFPNGNLSGVSSEPTMPRDGVNRSHADSMRAAL